MTDFEPPRGLGARGKRFWRDATARFELGLDEVELLVELCMTLDTIDGLAGGPQTSAHARELRLQRGELRHLTAALGLPDGAGKTVPSGNTQRARRAAQARWDKKTKGADDGKTEDQ